MTPTTRTLLRAEGFSCPSCVRKIEKALDALPGGTDEDPFWKRAQRAERLN
ncbi:heavy-metal-associated domain-containing protein, partial [Micrococcus sp. JV4]|uniref:heavy-metal-associated domain-containing protein n=1 Tax=Micrococcus sp. JV4 TaxID=2666106 RepID=UPI001EF2B45C